MLLIGIGKFATPTRRKNGLSRVAPSCGSSIKICGSSGPTSTLIFSAVAWGSGAVVAGALAVLLVLTPVGGWGAGLPHAINKAATPSIITREMRRCAVMEG